MIETESLNPSARHASIRHLLVALCCSVVLPSAPACAATRHVSDSAALADAWRSAGAGDRIVLAPGNYAAVDIKGGGGGNNPVTITSADATEPAHIGGLALRGVAGVAIEDIVLDYTFTLGDDLKAFPFLIEDSRDIALRRVVFDGDLARDLNAASDGLPAGFGLIVMRTDGLTLENSEIRKFWKGFRISATRNVRIVGNDMHSLRMDGMNMAEVENVLIEGNRIHNFDRAPLSEDHADMIQFWTAGTMKPTRNVTIRGNLLNSEGGIYTQSIFMGNNLIDQGLAGEEMYFRDITIEDNLIINAHAHGISLGASLGVRIVGNIMVHNPESDGDRDILALYRPRLTVSPLSRDVVIEQNVANGFILPEAQSGWQMDANMTIQDIFRLKPNHYSHVFVGGDASDPATYMPRPGGPLSGSNVASIIRPWLK